MNGAVLVGIFLVAGALTGRVHRESLDVDELADRASAGSGRAG
ncbi:hypothetical protein ABGB07_18690 [Micromonosporaceae bacterium B7E4]